MKRRRFLQGIGAGSVGAGAVVGTGSYSRIKSQRRVKIKVGEHKEDLDSISGFAFCQSNGGITKDNIRIDAVTTDGDDPISVEWTALDDDGNEVDREELVDRVVVWGASIMYNREPVSPIIRDGEVIGDDSLGKPGDDEQSTSSPCPDGECGPKFDDWNKDQEEFETEERCTSNNDN